MGLWLGALAGCLVIAGFAVIVTSRTTSKAAPSVTTVISGDEIRILGLGDPIAED